MTKEEFIKRDGDIKKPVIEKYGSFLYFLIADVLNIGRMEKVVEAAGFKTKRVNLPNQFTCYSEILCDDKVIGVISNQGLPSVEFYKRKRKYCQLIEDNPAIIEPIKGVHRILDWHTVKGKQHRLAGGETILHFLPVEMPEDLIQDLLTKTGLINKVDEFQETERLAKLKLKEQQLGGGEAILKLSDTVVLLNKKSL